jgi:hypothetical protein
MWFRICRISGLCDERNQTHLPPAVQAQQREHLLDASKASAMDNEEGQVTLEALRRTSASCGQDWLM